MGVARVPIAPYLVEQDPDVVVPEYLPEAEEAGRHREDLGRADELDAELAAAVGGGALDLGALPERVLLVEHLDHVPGVEVRSHGRGRTPFLEMRPESGLPSCHRRMYEWPLPHCTSPPRHAPTGDAAS
jgi:hypothetical protein